MDIYQKFLEKFWNSIDNSPKIRALLFALLLSKGASYTFNVMRCLYAAAKRSQLNCHKIIEQKYNNVTDNQEDRAWALITGGSSGIGKAFAHELARSNFNIYIISNDQQGNYDTSSELKQKFPTVLVQTMYLDICDPNFVYELSKIEYHQFRVLVNSAGITHIPMSDHANFKTLDEMKKAYLIENNSYENIFKCFQVNCVALTQITNFYVERKLRESYLLNKQCLIINMSSFSAFLSSHTFGVYGSGKNYVKKLSEQLAFSLQDKGIDVVCLCPGFVQTNLINNFSGKITITLEELMKEALKDICLKKTVSVPNKKHQNQLKQSNFLTGIYPKLVYANGNTFGWNLTKAVQSQIK